ncbi:SDR family NAD(P)-dependent oxidoreductase [Fibrella sp. HMF5335]|uniref:SDR family NAD(P)-dependent oxidoreductase n=1 Tax=Fibrella rubiginis TaxID=2817060 RepID=A0A939GF33_9BACT|nr:SDR family NAD(P)-dependent oxidoreductase [Fibrella rubiginis]MBO0936628.1 SDR family NAD(P)-dependent oxidoreductase [Fibrella rubiginis]
MIRTAHAYTIIITGGHTGLGLAASRHILTNATNVQLVWASRSGAMARQTALDMAPDRITVLHLDLAKLADVQQFVASVTTLIEAGTLPPLGAVVCNAGVQFAGGLHQTTEGIEETFGVNHLAHFLLVNLLLSHLLPTGQVVVVSSGTHFNAPRIWQSALFGMPAPQYLGAAALARGAVPAHMNPVGNKANQFRYTTSKLCNLLFMYELDRRLRAAGSQITVTAFDPGLMPGTGLARSNSPVERWAWNYVLPILRLFDGVNSVDTSGRNLARLATDPAMPSVSGQYVEGTTVVPSSVLSRRPELWSDLWAESQKLIELNTMPHVPTAKPTMQ